MRSVRSSHFPTTTKPIWSDMYYIPRFQPLYLLRGRNRATVEHYSTPDAFTDHAGACYHIHMNTTEQALRAIKDRIAAALGCIDETAPDAAKKDNFIRLNQTARDLHRCADDMQNILMRIRPR